VGGQNAAAARGATDLSYGSQTKLGAAKQNSKMTNGDRTKLRGVGQQPVMRLRGTSSGDDGSWRRGLGVMREVVGTSSHNSTRKAHGLSPTSMLQCVFFRVVLTF
jgi:hypothetical protein